MKTFSLYFVTENELTDQWDTSKHEKTHAISAKYEWYYILGYIAQVDHNKLTTERDYWKVDKNNLFWGEIDTTVKLRVVKLISIETRCVQKVLIIFTKRLIYFEVKEQVVRNKQLKFWKINVQIIPINGNLKIIVSHSIERRWEKRSRRNDHRRDQFSPKKGETESR